MPGLRRLLHSLSAGAALAVAVPFACVALLAPAASAAPGDLDPTFGSGGSARFLPSHEEIALRGVAVQPDGKVVLTGVDQATAGVLVVRLLENGELDPSFGNGGVVTTLFPGGYGEGRAVAIQPNGRIVVVGQAKGALNSDFLAVRYRANGAPDTTFGGGDGIEIVPVGADEDRAEAVAIGGNGRILLAGESRLPMNAGVEAGIAVLGTDGKPDPGFGTNGVKTLNTTGVEKTDRAGGIAEQADGKIVIADETGKGGGSGFTVVRLLADGTPDPGFGAAGVANTPIPGAPASKGRAADVAVQPDGRIVASGSGFDEVEAKTDYKFAAVRYLADGKLDPSFGGAGTGIFSQQISPGEESARTLALTPGGKLVLAGRYAPTPSDSSVAVVRLDPFGVPDPTFGTAGIALRGPTAPFGNNFEAAALDSRERTVVVSRDYVGGGDTIVEVSRFLGDVLPDQPPGPTATGSPANGTSRPRPTPRPRARVKPLPRKLAAAKLGGFSGTASDAGGTLAKVQIALVRVTPAKGGGATTCQQLRNARGRFRTVKAKGRPCPPRWLDATGTAKWRFKLKSTLPPGRYVVSARPSMRAARPSRPSAAPPATATPSA
ncbi:MAG TPA: hypothetical protein VHA54_10705 [Solirubrobacterales bacterium]|nr:hypothetical protein [Solirubrobacterales bacterium]